MKKKGRIRLSGGKSPSNYREDIDPALLDQFCRFIEYHSTQRLSQNLRKVFMEFLMCEGATEVSYLQDVLFDLEGLFELLDAIQASKEK